MPLAVASGWMLPAGVAALWGDWRGGLLVGGFTRIMLQSQSTMCVNSLAHWVGSQPYTRLVSAVDNFIVALLTLGDGWHNFHHAFPTDFRCGIGPWKLDMTKWGIRFLAWAGSADDLVRTPEEVIAKVRLETAAF